MLCFPEFFFGLVPVSDYRPAISALQSIAKASECALVTGNIPLAMGPGSCSQRLVTIDSDGSLLTDSCKRNPYAIEARGYVDGGTLQSSSFGWGSVLTLNGLDAIDADLVGQACGLQPDLLVLQVNPASALEAEALREYGISLARCAARAVIVPVHDSVREVVGSAGFAVDDSGLTEESPGIDSLMTVIEISVRDSRVAAPMGTERALVPELLRQRMISEMGGGPDAAGLAR